MSLRERMQDRRIRRKTKRGAQGKRPNPRPLPEKATSAEMPPVTNVKPPASDMKVDNTVSQSAPSVNRKTTPPAKTNVPKRPKVTGMDGRNVSTKSPTTGKRTLANVTRENMTNVGLDPNKTADLTKYLNKFDELKRRPKKSDFKKVGTGKLFNKAKEKRADKKLDPKTVARRDKYYGGGMMKTKGMKAGGKMKTKGATAGGKMKTKGYKKGGKVRGAGIARKGVRPAKMF